ncbi:MAG: hypothetical protein ACRDGI_08335 [Candidatus Limnocylindrales bacterium]
MTNHATRVPLRLAGLAVAAFLLAAAPAGVLATTNAPIAETGGMTATLPLMGTPLTVAVTLDASGKVADVALDPSTALSKTKSGDDFVKFTNTDGSSKVTVKAKGGQLAIKAKAKTLSDLVGTGSWSADVFGTGAKSSASYTIGTDGSGNPTVVIATPTTPAGIVWMPAVTPGHKSGDKAKAGHAVASGTFTWQGFTKVLSIGVNVSKSGTASLAITLSGRDAQKLNGTLDSLAGARTWSATTCAGTPVKVSFHVASDGTVVYDGSTGGTATEKTFKNGFLAWFDKGRTGVFVNLVKQSDGTYTLFALGRSGDCGGHGHKGFGHHGWYHWQWGPPVRSNDKPKSH